MNIVIKHRNKRTAKMKITEIEISNLGNFLSQKASFTRYISKRYF